MKSYGKLIGFGPFKQKCLAKIALRISFFFVALFVVLLFLNWIEDATLSQFILVIWFQSYLVSLL